MFACNYSPDEVVDILLSKGADVNAFGRLVLCNLFSIIC
jgi:hypothetical protein